MFKGGAFCIHLLADVCIMNLFAIYNRQTAETSYPCSGFLLKRSDEIGPKPFCENLFDPCYLRSIPT